MTPDAAEPERPTSQFHRLLHERTPRLIVTPALVAIIAIVYGAMVFTSGGLGFSTDTLMTWGALFGPSVAAGDWWRLATAIFLHANLLHVGLNALALWRLGAIVERLLGPPVFLVVYLSSGIAASLASVQFHAVPVVGVGASGAIFGIAGALLAMVVAAGGSALFTPQVTTLGRDLATPPIEPPPLPNRQDAMRELLGELRGGVISFVIYNVMFGLMVPQVDNAAHLGGLAGGVIIGWLVGRHAVAARPTLARTIVPIVLTIALAAASVAWLRAHQGIEAEIQNFGPVTDRHRTAFDRALRSTQAGSVASADTLEQSVQPEISSARQRAAVLLDRYRRRVADASKLDQYGRLVYWRQLPGLRYELDRAEAWHVYLTMYQESWRLRTQGLRTRDQAMLRRAVQVEADATRELNAVLERPRPVEPH
jgi:membrane associated rhomboid family serine protease